MHYSKLQKFISSLLIFSLLFGITFRFPLPSFLVSAASNEVFDLVSIIVPENTYSELKNEIDRYGKDISSVLENTKTVILPIPAGTTAFQIASMNEALYYEGYKVFQNVNFESRLVGTVLVGDIPLPLASIQNEIAKTVLPYTDFDDKSYIFNRETELYEANRDNVSGVKPEIWHGIISPNMGSAGDNITALKDFFDKDHDYYTANGLYAPTKRAMNGNPDTPLSNSYEPFVFYFDQFREESGLNYPSYLAYNSYLDNKEDIVYNRFTTELANKLKGEVLQYSQDEVMSMMTAFDPTFNANIVDNSVSDIVPDIQARHIIENATNKFLEIFSKGSMSSIRENVYNAGRYNIGQNVNVDFIPYLITVLDTVNDEIIKEFNNDLEDQIDTLVANGFSRKLAIPTLYTYDSIPLGENMPNSDDGKWVYENYLFGKKASNIANALECTYYRGSMTNSGQLVEANRGLNVFNIEPDFQKLQTLGSQAQCFSQDAQGRIRGANGYWGWNTPINLDESSVPNFKLKSSNIRGAITELYDINGATKITDSLATPSPLQCLSNNYLLSLEEIPDSEGNIVTTYKLPTYGNSSFVGWNCTSNTSARTYYFSQTFDQNYLGFSDSGLIGISGCHAKGIVLDGRVVRGTNVKPSCDPEDGSPILEVWEYKSVPSHVVHKSPTATDLASQINSMMAPNLPVDEDRYIDFIAQNGAYIKINYPYLFRIQLSDNVTMERVAVELDKVLDIKSAEINDLITRSNPSSSSFSPAPGLSNNASVINLLKTGDYPSANFNLKAYLKGKPASNVNINGSIKTLSYYDVLVFALYWNNLPSVSSKYQFVFEHYLSSNNDVNYYLPKGKSEYEISYLASFGNSQNMFVGVDPEGKADNPYGDIIAANQDLSTKIFGLNISGTTSNTTGKKFKCAPPEGVPLWEWLPAIMCRLEDMMPPTIGFGDGTCGSPTLSFISDEEKERFSICNSEYANREGINDCLEDILANPRNEQETEIGTSRLFLGSNIFNNNEGFTFSSASSVMASSSANIFLMNASVDRESITNSLRGASIASEKLVFSFGNLARDGTFLALAYPLTINLYDDVGNFLRTTDITNEVSTFQSLFTIDKAGAYKLEMVDRLGNKNTINFNILPALPARLELNLGTSILKSGGAESTNFLTIYDNLGNVVKGNYYDIEASISGDSLVFADNNTNKLNTSTFEGYKIFRLRSSSKTGKADVNISIREANSNQIILNTRETINVIQDFRADIIPESEFKVGGEKYAFGVELRDTNGNILQDVNSRVYINANSSFLELEEAYIELKAGIGRLEFRSKTLAGKDIPIELNIDGLGIVSKSITILPDLPMKMDLVLDKNKIEASKDSYANLQVELRDRYNNLVFNDSQTEVSVEISPKYSRVISVNPEEATAKDGKANFRIYASDTSGLGYFRVSAPSIAGNSFTIGEAEDALTISSVTENAGMLQSFYVWNKSKVDNMQYNAIYTTMLGADYGNIDERNYLAGELIFNKNSKALAVSTILNNPYTTNDIISVNLASGVNMLYNTADLSQDIRTDVNLKSNGISLNLFNNSLNTYIGEVYFALPRDLFFSVCDRTDNSCFSTRRTSIFGKSLDSEFAFYTSGGKLSLTDTTGKTYLEISSAGEITKKENLDFELIPGKNLLINVKYQNRAIGTIGLNFIDSKISLARDEGVFTQKIESASNEILVYLNSILYGYHTIGRGKDLNFAIYYKDPFASENSINSFSRGNMYAFENTKEREGLGWKDGNKTLLSFSAGETAGESLREFASFSSVNIGDPVISLKQLRKPFNDSSVLKQFDSTIGEIINKDSDLHSYRVFDYNADGRPDILLIKNNGYLSLLENSKTESRFLSLGDLAYIADIGNPDNILTGDFTGDSYDDIFFVGEDGNPYLLNNINKSFSRLSLVNKFNLKGKIINAKVFDMDNDGKDDIITLDDSGEINIFYGGGTSSNPTFTKLLVSNDYGLKLDETPRQDSGFVYFDGLQQINPTDYSHLLERTGENQTENVNRDFFNSVIFEQIIYSPEAIYNALSGNEANQTEKTFIRSEYGNAVSIKVERTIKDRNGAPIKAGDFLDVELTIKNEGTTTRNNMVYIENVLSYMTLDLNSISNSKNLEAKNPSNGYDLMFDDFSLRPEETLIIRYSGVVKSLKYLEMQVGLFENGEAGDDEFGDIIMKTDNRNCATPVDIFRSIGARSYDKGLKTPTCDEEKVRLPDELAKNAIDTNGNGIPDYIDTLINNQAAQKDYANSVLESLHVSEDSFSLNGSLTIDLGGMTESVENSIATVQSILDGLSCGFGGGACYSTPLNWAPLAPGSDPTFMGYPIGDGLMVGEGLPVFSALTGLQTMCGYTPCCIPTVWPASPLAYVPGPACGTPSAGGRLGTWAPTNFFRLFVTPTLTGAVGIAACFGGPAMVAGYSNPIGVHPFVPGGNCIVAAQPILGCSNDGSDGDPRSLGIPTYSTNGNNSFGIINGNCTVTPMSNEITQSSAQEYYNYLMGLNGNYEGLYDLSSSILGKGNNGAITDHTTGNFGPLFTIGDSIPGQSVSISIDSSSRSIDFSDVTKIVQKRVSSFPSFLMDWVTRQIEEIANKLTDFPTLFVILPDFSGLYDTELTWDQNKANWRANNTNNNYSGLFNAIGHNDSTSEVASSINSNETIQGINSSVKDAYEFISSIPIINLTNEPVSISIPWSSKADRDRAVESYKATFRERSEEAARAYETWKYQDEAAANKFRLDSNRLLSSLQANINVIESYAELPEKVYNMLNVKERYLEQLMCNIETLSKILGGRIGANGERFKAWVELYMLIKAILKSWQLLVDVFVDYEASCHQCKNERNDLQTFIWELISAVVPSTPVIQFPKWPDIILDLHNIRANLDISLPEFKISVRPFIFPNLPSLNLPNSPGLGVSLPALPVLPEIIIPTLPDLPTLPTINLPDLPPPPTLPKMLASLEVMLDVLRLVTKMMCFLKTSPFVPEWRAGDQIAFITERNGYLPLDFLNLSQINFSFPFVDAIRVSTYVNLEVQADFITEMARQTALPINRFTGDATNIFNISLQDVNISTSIEDIDVRVGNDGSINSNLDVNNGFLRYMASIVSKQLLKGVFALQNWDNDLVSNSEFKKAMNESLASSSITNEPKLNGLKGIGDEVNSYTFSKENEIIANLEKNNEEKFSLVKDIINTEIIKNKRQKEELKELFETGTRKVAMTEGESSVELYNKELSKYNEVAINNLSKLVNYDETTSEKTKLQAIGNDLITKVDRAFSSYDNNLLAVNVTGGNNSTSGNNFSGTSACTAGQNGDYGYNYTGLYILENNSSYRLFDYLGELTGNEEMTLVDIDSDGDEDILYFMNGTLYFKENLDIKAKKVYLKENPLLVNPSNNKFVRGNFLEAVNNFASYTTSSSLISVTFQALQGVNNYRLGFYDVVDKYFNERNDSYTPKYRKKRIIDAIAGEGTVNLIEETPIANIAKNLVYISALGDLRGIMVTADELRNIRDDLVAGTAVNLSGGTRVYTTNSRAVLGYLDNNTSEVQSIIIPANSYAELKTSLKVTNVIGDAYVKTGGKWVWSDADVRDLLGKPLFAGAKIEYKGNDAEVPQTSYVELEYYDGTNLSVDFNFDKSWELYDLGMASKRSYSIVTSGYNNFYYAKINGFKDGIVGTLSNQVLLAPQIQADNYAPELNLTSIKIPVYQQRTIDLLNYIYEDSGIENIKDIYIDFNLQIDSDGDGNPKNDRDSDTMPNLSVSIGNGGIFLTAGPFNELMNKTINVVITDSNGNVGYNEINFEVYSPTPYIEKGSLSNFYGILDEELTDEPVNIYRLRGGVITRLEDVSGEDFVMTSSGAYSFIVGDGKEGLRIEDSTGKVADVNERTGKINIYGAGYTINVIESNNPGNESIYPRITLLSDKKEEVFFETIKSNSNLSVRVVNSFEGIGNYGIFIKFSDTQNYTYILNPENLEFNPGVLAIYRAGANTFEELFIVFPDGRINTLNQNYYLSYSTFEDYVVLILTDRHFGREVARVLYKVDADYVVR